MIFMLKPVMPPLCKPVAWQGNWLAFISHVTATAHLPKGVDHAD